MEESSPSMRFLIPAYLVAFLFVTVGSVRESLKDEEPWWIIVAEIVLALSALIGYVAYHLDYRDPGLLTLWSGVAPIVLVGYLYLIVRDLRGIEPQPDFSDSENVWVNTIGAFLGVLFMAPILWSNVLLAFS